MIFKYWKNAVSAALYNNDYKMIEIILENWYDVSLDGTSLRQAIDNSDVKTINLLLNAWFDVNNYHPDMVYPYNAPPIAVAARKWYTWLVNILINCSTV